MADRGMALFRRRGIEAIAGDGDRLSADALVHHARSLAPGRVALPALRFGAEFLARWRVREEPLPFSWRDAGFDCVAPAVFVVRDAVVHGSCGVVSIGGDIVEETLAGVDLASIGAVAPKGMLDLPAARVVRLDGLHVSLLAGGQTNFFHAVMDGVARVAAVPEHFLADASGVLLPAQGGVQQALLPLLRLPGHLAVRPVADGEAVCVERLVLPMSVYGTAHYHPVVGAFFDRVSGNVADGEAGAFPRRVYLDRRGVSGRRLVNEAEVIERLSAFGFVPVAAERLSLADQVRLFRGAEAIVAPHGAGLTNIGFCRAGCRILELQMDAYVHWGFRHLAALRGLDYDCVAGRALGVWHERSAAVHGLEWMISADHVAAAVQAGSGLDG